jgi:transcriptional regulator with XRE-family HTH domain
MSQEQLAGRAQVAVATVRKIEKGVVIEPGYFTVLALMHALGATREDMTGLGLPFLQRKLPLGCPQGLVDGEPFHGRDAYRASTRLTWEPVSGIEPLTNRLQEVRFVAICALTALMRRVIALMALAALGFSGDSSHAAEQQLTRSRNAA